MNNNYNFKRFIKAQEKDYDKALKEIKNGKKITHWMWYIFPQINGLGKSQTSIYYSIENIEEAKEYLNNEILGKRLREITEKLLELKTNDSVEIFGTIDSLKLKSCMTLFDYIEPNSIFNDVLNKYYKGQKDNNTLQVINKN